MSDYYEGENGCLRCLRNSPVASLLGFIAVLLGVGSFGGATVFARRHLDEMLHAPHLFPCLEYVVYGLIGITGLFAALAYFMCALSSGRNAKHCFESSRKSACARCCNMTFILSIVFGIFIWVAIVCLIGYSVMSIALLMHRQDGPTRLRLASLENPRTVRGRRGALQLDSRYTLINVNDMQSSLADNRPLQKQLEELTGSRIPESVTDVSGTPGLTKDLDTMRYTYTYPDEYEQNFRGGGIPSNLSSNPNVVLSHQVPQNIPKSLQGQGKQLLSQALSLEESAKQFFKCDSDSFDLSYYGLYDDHGLPIHVARDTFMNYIQPILICTCVAVGGILLMILGYLQILICTAINFARLQERRYYEASDAGEEGVALQQ